MGFFTQSELKEKSQIKVDPNQLKSKCLDCGLYKNKQKHPQIEITGEGKKGILIIGDQTTEEDDLFGVAFAGDEGDFLTRELRKENIILNRDCWRVKATRCYSKEKVTAKQAIFCAPYIEKIIKTKKPKIIIVFGPTTKADDTKSVSLGIVSLFGKQFSDREILTWRDFCIPHKKYNCHIFPLLGPIDVLNNPKDKNKKSVFHRDLKTFARRINNLPEITQIDYKKNIVLLKNIETLKKTLKTIIKNQTQITYDYETNSLKPFKKGTKIVTISFATPEKIAYSFPYEYRDFWTAKEKKEIWILWKKILKNKNIKKIAFNAKFEEIWGKSKFNQRHTWHFDPMICNHVLDNRPRINSLTFLCMVRLGIEPYDKEIKKYLDSHGEEFNKVEKAPLKDLLIYNGYDVIYTQILYEIYIRKITKSKGLLKAYNFFMRGNKEMAELQINGIQMDTVHYKKTRKLLKSRIKKIKKRLEEGREARAFIKKYNRPILLTSNQDLGELFYNILGQEPVYTKKNNYKTDKKTLEKFNLPFVKKLFEKKKYEKALGTYLAQFEREITEKGKIHPFFDLHIPISYRSSSSMPNWQNQPKRDKEIKKMIRSGMIPSKGCVLSEIDFSGSEVIASASCHKDPKFIGYLEDKSTDMHRDNASDLLLLPHEMFEHTNDYTEEQMSLIKDIRFFAKNAWTFAQFYGDWYGSCAPVFWANVIEDGLKLPNGMTCQEWLEDKGIYELGTFEHGKPTPGSFLEHCQRVENKMWNERFPQYTQWKKDIVEFYQTYGYIDNMFGFRFTGLMTNNQCTNFPIQSASFHLLLYTLIETQKMIKRKNLRTKLVGQVHDSIIGNVPKDEIKIYHKEVHKIVSNLKNVFKWLVVPMEIEAEITKLREDGGNFSKLKEVDPTNAKLWY